MRFLAYYVAVLVVASFCCAAAKAQHVATTGPLPASVQLGKFHLPPGFEIQLVASEPDIHKPVNLSFDVRGRLWLSETVEYPFAAKEGHPQRDAVKVIEFDRGTGKRQRVTTFVEGLNIPLGVLPIGDGAIVFSIPNVCRYRDTDGDGKSDDRQVLYATFGQRDTHGMVNSFTRGLDGCLYACHGFANESEVKGGDGQAVRFHSGNVFRMRTDGSHLEYVTHGQVNPFGLCFDPRGDLYSADCHTLPIYMLLRGACYPSFGKAHDGLGFAPTLMSHSHGSTGIGGIAYYAAEQFPAEYRDTIFVGNPVTGRINHDRIVRHGSTPQAVELPDFVTCDDPWFHPVNLQVGLDGALYIADFYNRIIAHYEVPLDHPGRDRERGRIWRVIYTGKQVSPSRSAETTPDIAGASLQELAALLGHGNLTVRSLATQELVDRFGSTARASMSAILESAEAPAVQTAHALWVLERTVRLTAEQVRACGSHPDSLVRTHLMRVLAEREKWDEAVAKLVRRGLSDRAPDVRRAAADALGQHPNQSNVAPLLAAWKSAPAADSHLVHTLRMSLRGQLKDETVYPSDELSRDDRVHVANVCLGIATAPAAEYVWRQLEAGVDLRPLDAYLHHLVRHADRSKLDAACAYAVSLHCTSPQEECEVLRAIARGLEERGAPLSSELTAKTAKLAGRLLNDNDESLVRLGIELARELKPDVFDLVAKLAVSTSRFVNLRPAAIEACLATDSQRASYLLASILEDASEAENLRQLAAGALARVNVDAARRVLVRALATAPSPLALAIAAGLAESDRGAADLLTAIEQGRASRMLLQDSVVSTRLQARRVTGIDKRMAALVVGLPPQDVQMRERLARQRKQILAAHGSHVQGEAVFQKYCAACHRVGERGAKVGPNLDGIGTRGLDRLLEDILDPNRNVDQAFRTTQALTEDGRIVSGLALREEGKLLVLADAQGKEVRVALDEIEERHIAPLSLMPGNMADQVGQSDLPHLMAYLLSLKAVDRRQ